MIRKVLLSLKFANRNKLRKLEEFIYNYCQTARNFIDYFWEIGRFHGSFVKKEVYDLVYSPLPATVKQLAAQHALKIVKSQRKKKSKTKPNFQKQVVELDSRFIEIQTGLNSFDLWIKFKNVVKMFVPTQKHKQFTKFAGWQLKKSGRLYSKNGQLYLDIFFEKPEELKTNGETIGLDCGYRKLATLSSGQMVGTGLVDKIAKISNKKQGSNAFKRALIERNDYINKELKKIPYSQLKTIVVENLTGLSKRKMPTPIRRKLQRWIYSYLLKRLTMNCEVNGVHTAQVNPAYTSTTCTVCGDSRRENRVREIFKCASCGHTADADYNASLNILNRFLSQEATTPVKTKKGCLVTSR